MWPWPWPLTYSFVIWEICYNNVSQGKIANNLSPSTVHNIVKRFRESREILVRKGQGGKPLLIAHDHEALRRHSLRNCHATMMDIATWAREYFGNHCHSTQSAAALKSATWNCIMQRGNAFINFVQKCCQVLWALNHLTWAKNSGNMFSGQTSPHFSGGIIIVIRFATAYIYKILVAYIWMLLPTFCIGSLQQEKSEYEHLWSVLFNT